MKYSIKSDKGKKRKDNEDSCGVFFPDENSCVAVVCDGMGGANAGEIASKMAVSIICERVKAGWRNNMSAESVKNLLLTSVTAANICVYDDSVADSEHSGMGTTVVIGAVTGEKLIVAHAGDSRAYLLKDGELKLLTTDHSLVRELIDSGLIDERDSEKFPGKNIITRALGVSENIKIDFSTFSFHEGEKLLLCTDGLTNFVRHETIKEIMENEDEEQIVESLIELANNNGGGDNITAVVVSNR